MSWSLRESQALALKAARGAGFSWGLAEEAGYAVHWLQAHGAPGVRTLANYLTWRDSSGNTDSTLPISGEQHDPNGFICPITLGATLSDVRVALPSRLGRVRQPLLLVPFIAAATPSGSRRLTWQDTQISISRNGFVASSPGHSIHVDHEECQLAEEDRNIPAPSRFLRVPESEADYIAILGKFAARTYAPATDESRAAAGSSLSDND